jgi:hypothetical protein
LDLPSKVCHYCFVDMVTSYQIGVNTETNGIIGSDEELNTNILGLWGV